MSQCAGARENEQICLNYDYNWLLLISSPWMLEFVLKTLLWCYSIVTVTWCNLKDENCCKGRGVCDRSLRSGCLNAVKAILPQRNMFAMNVLLILT